MPKFIAEDGNVAPIHSGTFDFANGAMMIPSGNTIADLELRNIDDTLSTLEYRVQYIPASGQGSVMTDLGLMLLDLNNVGPQIPSGTAAGEVGSIQAWYDDRSLGVINGTSGVQSLADLTVNGNTLQHGPSLPSVVSGYQNSRRTIWFDGIDDWFGEVGTDLANSFSNSDQPFTVMFAGRWMLNGGNNSAMPWCMYESGGGNEGYINQYDLVSDATIRFTLKDSFGNAATGITSGEALQEQFAIYTVLSSGTGSSFFINGSGIYEGVSHDGGVARALNKTMIGDWKNQDGNNAYFGAIGEIAFWNEALSDANRRLVEKNMSYKWDIVINE